MCRCPGRQVWRTLQIEDCRHITTVEAMFEQICKHIKQSTNNGIIIPTISIFPPRKVDKDHLGKQLLFSNFSCMFLNPNLNSNCSNSLDMRNIQEQVKQD